MKLADLFVAPNFIKVDEYYEIEIYFNTDTYFFYRLEGNDDGWIVIEYRPTHEKYIELMTAYHNTIKEYN